MSGVPEDVLPEGWDALSRADAEALAPPEDAKERVRLRVAATLGLAAGLGAAAGAIASAAGTAANPLPAKGLLSAMAKALLLKKAVVLGALAATVVTGGAYFVPPVHSYVQTRLKRMGVTSRSSGQAARTEVESPPALALQTPHAPQAAAAVEPAAASVPLQPPDSLGEERALLDDARRAILRGRTLEAQALLLRHAHLFPDGRLVEEREALSIRLLVRQGHSEEARLRAKAFKQRHPQSIQQPGIDDALRSARH